MLPSVMAVVYREAKCDALVFNLSQLMCVIDMALPAYSICIYVNLEQSSVMVSMTIFKQCNSAFLAPKS